MPSSTVANVPRPRVPKDAIYQPPAIAWPTVGLFFAALTIWAGALWGALTGHLSPILAVALQAGAVFMFFTVLHDGVHRSLMRGYPRLNDFVAMIAGAFLSPIASCAAFRYAHFKHHRCTNEPGVDPDMWSGVGPAWRMPLQWATADLRYAVDILQDWKIIPVIDRVRILTLPVVLLTLFGGLSAMGWGWEVLIYGILPARIAVLWLAFAFNFLPHHPHTAVQAQNPYAATNAREGIEPLMRWIFLQQNYHIIHHLFPGVPFYRYQAIWKQQRSNLIQHGTPVVRWHQIA